MQKLKDKLGRFFRLVMFIIFTIVWSFFVYVIDGEWLYFIPLFVADALFWKTFNFEGFPSTSKYDYSCF